MPYFTSFNHSECLILQVLIILNALFYKFRVLPMPYFAKNTILECLILQTRLLIAFDTSTPM